MVTEIWVLRDRRLPILYLESIAPGLHVLGAFYDASRFGFRQAMTVRDRLNAENFDKFVAVVDPMVVRVCRGKGQRRNRRVG